jgi:signal transduction histidine kinase
LLEQEQRARSAAENANRMKDEFLATVSHELRTPLNAIIGWCHMLKTRPTDPTITARAIDTIDRNAKAQAQLVEDILDASRVITGKLQLSIARVDLSAAIYAAIDSIQLAAESKGIRMEVIADPHVRYIRGDAARLQQIVWNLLSNAVKFTSEGGEIVVRLQRSGSNAEITVTDSGEGITPEFLPFIFERFSQADSSTTRRQGGLGLGLAIVRHLTELHGGRVVAESEGKGARRHFQGSSATERCV